MSAARPRVVLSDLRQAVARIEGITPDLQTGDVRPLPFGIAALDRALAGGLAPASLHEVTPDAMADRGSAIGFTLALAARAARPGKTVVWITTDFAALEAGEIYGLGCDLAGLPARDLVVVKTARPIDALWAMEEALKCHALSGAVVELPNDAPLADLTATRRLTLAAREGGAFAFLLRHRATALTSSAETRWRVSAAPSLSDAFGGLGRTAFSLSLHKNRRGPTGHWTIAWSHHDRTFSPLSFGVAAPAFDRPARTPRRSAGCLARRAALPRAAPHTDTEPVKSALRVSALNDAAARLNLQPGMPLADVRAMHPGIGVQTAEPAADRALLEAVADWCDRYTPLVALDMPDGLMLDISGCAHLFGGEATLMQDMSARLFRQGLHARVAVADTAGCAFAVARYGNPLLVNKGETLAALQGLPLSALRVDDDSVIALAQSGLKRIGDVIARPRAPLAARFGASLLRRLDQALGREEEAITPRLPVPSFAAERRFAEPIGLETDVLGTIERLAQDLSAAMERRGEGARVLQAALFRTDGKVYRFEAKAGEPLRDPSRIRRLFSERFTAIGDECDPGFGYDMVRLSALATERLDPVQAGLARDDHAAELSHLIDRLSARFGAARVTRLSPRDTHIPEFAEAAVPAQQAQSGEVGTGSPSDCAKHKKMMQASGAVVEPVEQDSLAPARPVRLFARPEEVKVTAEVPDGPPAQFIWRFITHDVVATEGPERIAMEWWRDADGRALTRDYFRVESRQGMRAWLYRDGLYGRETARPKWYLHGLFA